MKFSVITPNYNGARFLEKTILSVLEQKRDVELEYILIDGGSTDESNRIIKNYRDEFSHCVIEKDNGPAEAINKGFRLASGNVVAWLNSDDLYHVGTLARVRDALDASPEASMCFGGCRIINEQGDEVRSSISKIKEFFYPLSSRFTYQCINYISQPALFFRRDALEQAGFLREDMIAAWDYEFILRMWREGEARYVPGEPLSSFRWYEQSISGQNYGIQFKEEYEAAREDAGAVSMQTLLHFLVRWGIVGIYSIMSAKRALHSK